MSTLQAQGNGRGYRIDAEGAAGGHLVPLAPTLRSHPRPGSNSDGAITFHVTQDPISGGISPAMSRGNKQGCATIGTNDSQGVRRLTPRECERLQGFPDDWTLVDGLKCPDSRRYAAMGNAVTVNVAEWIARRIMVAA